MKQHEIRKAIPLLDLQGNLTEPGYAKKLLPVYRREDIKAPKGRIKEWDYYLINDGVHAVALTIDEQGQARTADWKVEVAERLIADLTGRYGMR